MEYPESERREEPQSRILNIGDYIQLFENPKYTGSYVGCLMFMGCINTDIVVFEFSLRYSNPPFKRFYVNKRERFKFMSFTFWFKELDLYLSNQIKIFWRKE